jgi:hypothetical protein
VNDHLVASALEPPDRVGTVGGEGVRDGVGENAVPVERDLHFRSVSHDEDQKRDRGQHENGNDQVVLRYGENNAHVALP